MRERLLLSVLALLCTANVLFAQAWITSNTTANTPVINSANDERGAKIARTSDGNFVVVWSEQVAGADDIRAKKINANTGAQIWVQPVCIISGDQNEPEIAADNAGNVFISWRDFRGGIDAVYVQKFDGAGTPLYTLNGALVKGNLGSADPPFVLHRIVADGAGGAIVAFNDYETSSQIRVQRFNASGALQWGTGTVATNDFYGGFGVEWFSAVSDNAGGIYVAWQDQRGPSVDIYALRLTAAGTVAAGWTVLGTAVCTQAASQDTPEIIVEPFGGVVVAWEDQRSGLSDIYAQRLLNNATIAPGDWVANGIPVCAAASNQRRVRLASNGSDGVIYVWTDFRSGTNEDIYAMNIIEDGTGAGGTWTTNGIPISNDPTEADQPVITATKNGTVIIAWIDDAGGANQNIYASHLNYDGSRLPNWNAGGEPVSTAVNSQSDPEIVANDQGGSVIIWRDSRASSFDVYAQLKGSYAVSTTVNAGDGSLREAITAANLASGRIHFGIPAPPYNIAPSAALPSILSDGVTIDGYSQAGSTPNTLSAGSNANILVEINTTTSGGFNVSGDNVKIRGLSIFGSGSGNGVFTLSSSGLSIEGCFLGLRANGALGALGNGVNNSGSNLLVGGPNVADRNVITGNTNAGILSSDGVNLTIINNIIGLDKAGEVSVGAQPKGISVVGINSGNILIGGALAGQGNLISNNSVAGIDFTNITNAANTRVFGNIIGLDKNATNRPTGGSQATGINSTGSQSNVGIGGVNAGEGNTISGNATAGVSFNAGGTVLMSNIRVQGNSIGLQKNGSSPITSGSQQYGVRFNLSVGTLSNAIVGDNGLGGRNTIADNTADGLDLNGTGVGSVIIGGNSIYNNTQQGIRLSGGANAGIIAPVVASVSTVSIAGTITGTGAPNKIIRVYTGKDDEGRKLLGQVQVPNGSSNWTLNGSFSLSDSITATYTDIDRTSAFSAALGAPASLPTWTLSNSGIGAGNLNGVAATLSRIITVGNTGKIYLSIDGALTWTLVGNGVTTNNLNSIVIPSNANSSGKGAGTVGTQGFGSAVAVGVGGTILRSNDGGSSWASVPSGSTSELNSVATAPDFTDSTLAKGTGTAGTQGFGSAVAVGVGGTILRSNDGGDTWSSATVGSAELNGVSVNGGFELRATAAKGTSTSGAAGTQGFGSAVAVGVGGTILRSDNGGDTWSTTTVGSSDLNDVSFTPNFEPLAAGSRSKGAGTSGTFGVNGFGSAVAVGVGGTILRSADGANWLNVSSNIVGGAVSNDLLSVQMTSELEGYISGTSGLVLKTVDGGTNWTPQAIPTTNDLNDIAVLADGSGFTAGDNQTLLVTNNSGDLTLPVSLLAFTASSNVIDGLGAVSLAWATESETDNAGFTVMRRENTFAGAVAGFQPVANYVGVPALAGSGSSTSQKDYRYTDDGVNIGSEYFYRLRSHDFSGTVHDYPLIATVRVEAAGNGSPKTYKYELKQNYPNPFNPQTTIAYSLQNAGQVELTLFNTLGQKVAVIDGGFKSAGEYFVTLRSDNLASGMYFYRLVAASGSGMIVQTRKLLIVK